MLLSATSKGPELSYAILFWSWILSWKYLYLVEISTFRGYYPHFVEISKFRGYYPHFVDISALCENYRHSVKISIIRAYYPHFVDTILIFHITSYPDRNICHVIHSFVLVVDTIFGRITSDLACNVYPISHILRIW